MNKTSNKLMLIILVMFVVFNELNIVVDCQMYENNNDLRFDYNNRPNYNNRQRERNRKKFRKTTLSPTTIEEEEETEPTTTTTTTDMPITDENGMSTADPLATTTPNVTTEHDHHIKSPFTYSSELLNQTHANMFKR